MSFTEVYSLTMSFYSVRVNSAQHMTIFHTMSWMSDIKHANVSDYKCKMRSWNMNDIDTHVLSYFFYPEFKGRCIY